MKKFINKLIVVALGLCCAIVMIPTTVAYAMEMNNDEYDTAFLKTINEYAEENCGGFIDLSAEKELLYDIDLNGMGYVYDFTLNAETGYAIVVNSNGYPEVAEIYFNAINPLNDIECKRVYVTNSVYVYSIDKLFYSVNGEKISEDGIEKLKGIAHYSAGAVITVSSETIRYTAKTETDAYQMARRHPTINKIADYKNACVPISGANVIQYWDRYLPNLIENYTPGVVAGSYYLYHVPNSIVINMAIQLYDLMGTNTGKDGATISQFKSGMTTYCSGKGYSISFESCMSSGKFNYALAKENMRNGRPVVFFVDPFTVATITNNGNSDEIEYKKVVAAHSVTGFGFKDIQYTLTNGQTMTNNYIEIASGLVECGVGYYNINYDTIIDDAYGIYIY